MEKSNEIKERFLQVAKNKGISYEVFFKGFKTTYDNFKGKSLKTSIRSVVLVDFSHKYPGVDLRWLITGKGNMYITKKNLVQEPEADDKLNKCKKCENLEKILEAQQDHINSLKATNKTLTEVIENSQSSKAI